MTICEQTLYHISVISQFCVVQRIDVQVISKFCLEDFALIVDLPDGIRLSGAIEVREKFGTVSGGDILDVGTEEGDFIDTLMKTLLDYNSFTGIDIVEDELEKAREQLKDAPVNFKVMNAETMNFQDNKFDTVCISYSIHHLENIEDVLAEMYRVLKPGGHFIIQELYSDGEQTTAQQVDKAVHDLNAKIDTLFGIPHFEALTRQKLKDLVNNVGLDEVESFESSWAVKCLFCKDVRDCHNPKSADNIDYVLKRIDDDLERVRGHPSFDELRKEAESLKERVRIDGSAQASLMYFFGKK
ncbi:MAG: methyltransferase domain-containing protein [Candidatus Thorarchaeota archaeon]|nr:MAG: methyltransferase domain-containing protein [Candidatus Thorarchaeota archaeon]